MSYHVLSEALLHASSRLPPVVGAANWIVMGVTLAANLFVTWWEAREGRRLQSPYLIADASHTRSDIYVSLGVVASFAGARAGLAAVDVVVAVAIAVFIAVMAVQILVGSFHTLTDRAVVPGHSHGQHPERGARRGVVPGDAHPQATRRRPSGPGRARGRRPVPCAPRTRWPTRSRRPSAGTIPEVVDVVVHLEPAERT